MTLHHYFNKTRNTQLGLLLAFIVYIVWATAHFYGNPKLGAMETVFSLVLAITVLGAGFGLTRSKEHHRLTIALTATGMLCLFLLKDSASWETLKLAGICFGGLVAVVLIIFADYVIDEVVEIWTGEVPAWSQDSGLVRRSSTFEDTSA